MLTAASILRGRSPGSSSKCKRRTKVRSMITDFLIRLEAASDREEVEELLLAAFPTSLELRLVRQLRKDTDVVFSLVAVEAAGVIGHALFSRLCAPAAALGLGPIAVTEKRRCRGVAAAMIEAGLERAKAEGWAAVVVVGDPSYYPRFGFSQEAVRGMSCQYAGPALMGLALADGGLDGPRIEYASAFSSIPD
ncbi:MAG: N-acetyltransferase [Bacteroidetes bacterium SB0662_bin_6]|nr:N-acetyltransferase [Bacteroidetes bacterium SB0668_bin_1]MYE03486.1 N-acetyltransferase [Bacteroidetes bacterium SB0662_bin_6]